MKLVRCFATLLVFVSVVGSAMAQTWTEEQREVWNVIDSQWKAIKAKEPKWDQFLHPKFMGWETDSPAPTDPRTVAEWSRFHEKETTVLVQTLFPLSIVVHGNTAVAHYLYSEGRDNAKTGRKAAHGRYTDILVKENGKWLFIAWHGGDAPAKAE